MKSIEYYLKQPNIVSPFQEIVNDAQFNDNPNFRIPEYNMLGYQLMEEDLNSNPAGATLDVSFTPQQLLPGYQIVVKGKDANDVAYEEMIHPDTRITTITAANCAYNLGLTVFDRMDMGNDLVNNGVINVGNSQGKTFHLSLDYDPLPTTCPTITGGVKAILVRDNDNERQLQGAPVYVPSSQCTASQTIVCAGNDLTACTVDGNASPFCETVVDDNANDVIRCNTYDQATGENTCVVEALGDGTAPPFTMEIIDSALVSMLSMVFPEPETNQYFDLSMENLATYGNYVTDGVSLTFFSILEDNAGALVSHKATYKFTVVERFEPIEITKPAQQLLVEWNAGKLRIPAATIAANTVDPANCGDGIKAYLYQSVEGMAQLMKVSAKDGTEVAGKAVDGTGQFAATELFMYNVMRRGEFTLGYELKCQNGNVEEVYTKYHMQKIEFIDQSNPSDLPCGVQPVIYGPSGQRFTAPFNFGANIIEVLTQVGDEFYVTVEAKEDANCPRIYNGEIAFLSLQSTPYMPCFLNNNCMNNVDISTIEYCDVDTEAMFTCPNYAGNDFAVGDNVVCTVPGANQGDPAVNVDCVAFGIGDPEVRGVMCMRTNNEASSCYITKYADQALYNSGFDAWNKEAMYYNQQTMSHRAQDGITFSPLMAKYRRMQDGTQGDTSPYLFVFYKGEAFNSVHRVKLEINAFENSFNSCTANMQQRSDNAQTKNTYFSSFNQQIGDLTFGSNIEIPAMQTQGCVLKYGIAERGFCGLDFHTEDMISPQTAKSIGYGEVARFMLEQIDQDSGPYFFAMSASCVDNGVYTYKTYEHEMVKFGSIIPEDYEDERTDNYEIFADIMNTAGDSLQNTVLGHPEIVVGQYNTPETEQIFFTLKVEPYSSSNHKYEFIKSQTVKLNFNDEEAALRDAYPEIYGRSPMAYTQVQSSNNFDCQVQDFENVDCTSNGTPVEGNCKVFKGSYVDPQNAQNMLVGDFGGCCVASTQECFMDVEQNTPNAVTFTDSLNADLINGFNQVILNAETMYGMDQTELKFTITLKDMLDAIQFTEQYHVEDLYIFVTVMNAQTGEAKRHELHYELVFNNDQCVQSIQDNKATLQNAMTLNEPIKTLIEWGEDFEVHASSVDAHVLVARVAHKADANCNTVVDVDCGDKPITEADPVVYTFSEVKNCLDGHTPTEAGKYIIQIEASKNNVVAYTYLTSELVLLPPGDEDRKENTCYDLIELLADANGELKNTNHNDEYEVDLNGADDATVTLNFALGGLDAQNCNYELTELMFKTYGDLARGAGTAGYVYSSQCEVRPPGLECFDNAAIGKFCEYEGVVVPGCREDTNSDNIPYVECRSEDEFGNGICGIWVADEFAEIFSLPTEPGLLELENAFNEAAEPVMNPATGELTFTAANIQTLFTAKQITDDYLSMFYAHAVVKNKDTNELDYIRMSFSVKFYQVGAICNMDMMFMNQPGNLNAQAFTVEVDANGDINLLDGAQQNLATIDIQDAIDAQGADPMNLIADLQGAKPFKVWAKLMQNGQLSTQNMLTSEVVCFDYPSCSFLPQQAFITPAPGNEIEQLYTYAEALDILSKEEQCFIAFKITDTLAVQNTIYYNQQIHLKMPAGQLPIEGTSFTIGFTLDQQTIDGTTSPVAFAVDLTQDASRIDFLLSTMLTPIGQSSPSISRCIFTTYADLSNLEKVAAESGTAFNNACRRIFAPNAVCTIAQNGECVDGQVTYPGCVEVNDLTGTKQHRCQTDIYGIPSCLVLTSTQPYPDDEDMFDRTDEEIKTKSYYNRALEAVDENCNLSLNVPMLTSLWEMEAYESPKTLEFYASYLATEDDGTELYVQRGPIQIAFTRETPPVSTDEANFIVEHFSKLIPYMADETELAVSIKVDTSRTVFSGKSVALLISVFVDEAEVEMYTDYTSSYEGAPWTYLQLAKYAGAILADDMSQRSNIYFRLAAIDVTSGNVLATLNSERLIFLPPTANDMPAYQATDCVVDSVDFEINGSAAPAEQVNNNIVLAKELTPATDSAPAIYENIMVKFSASSASCAANIMHECKLLPFAAPWAFAYYSNEIYYTPAFCEVIDPTDPVYEYTMIPGGQGLIVLKDESGNYRSGSTEPMEGYGLFKDNDSGYCAIITIMPQIMTALEMSLGQPETSFLKGRFFETFKVPNEMSYDVLSATLFPDMKGKTEMYYHCISKETTITQDPQGNDVTMLTSLKYNKVAATIVYQTAKKLSYDSGSKYAQFGEDLPLPNIMLMPYYKEFMNVVIKDLYLVLWDHETSSYTKFDPSQTPIGATEVASTNGVFATYEDLIQIQSQAVGFYEKQEYAKYDIYFMARLENTDNNEITEEVIPGDVFVLPPYRIENDYLSDDILFNINKPTSNAVKFSEDEYGRPTFSIYDVQLNLEQDYNVEVDFTNDPDNILIGFHVNNRKALSYYCWNSFRWQQDPSNSQCLQYPKPGCVSVNFSEDDCDFRDRTCETDYGQLEQCQENLASMDDSFISCMFGNECVTQQVERVSFDDATPLFQLGNTYTWVAQGATKASTTFKPKDVEEHFNLPQGESPKPFYAHAIYKREVAGSDPKEYTYHYGMMEFMLIGLETVLEVDIETKAASDALFTPVPTVNNEKVYTSGFDEAITIKATLTGNSIENPDEWKLTGGVLQAFSGSTGSQSFFSKQFATGDGVFEHELTVTEILRHVGFRDVTFGFSARFVSAESTSNLVTQIDGFKWSVTKPANGDADATLGCLTFDITMENDRGSDDPQTGSSMEPDTFGYKKMTFEVVHTNCANNAVYTLQTLEISKNDDLNTPDDSPGNLYFQYNRPQVAEDTTQDNEATLDIEEIRTLKFTDPNNDVLDYKIHAIFTDANGAAKYIIRDLSFDFTAISGQSNDYTCDGSFTKFPMYVALGGRQLNTDKIDSECDQFTGKYGAELQYLEWPFNTPLNLKLVPELAQCQGDTEKYIMENNGVFSFDWATAETEVFANKADAYARLTTGWYITMPGCDESEMTCRVDVNQDMTVTLTPAQQLEFTGGYDAEPKTTVLNLCNVFSDKEFCVAFYMPRIEAPMMLDPSQYSDFARLTRPRQDQSGTVSDVEIQADGSGSYQIDTSFALKYTIRDGECNNPIDGIFRTFDDLSQESIMRGMRRGDQAIDKDCEIVPMRSVNDDNMAPYEDASFKQYNECMTLQDAAGDDVIVCFEMTARGERKCYFKSRTVEHPQDSDKFKACYTKADFDDCPVSGRCVKCRAAQKADPESCIEPEKTPADGDCPPDTSEDCQEFDAYMDQVENESIPIDNSEFEPRSNLNKLLRDGEFDSNSVTFKPYVDAANYQSEGNKHNGATAPTPSPDFPRASKDIFVHLFCALDDGMVDYKVQKFTFTEQGTHTSSSDYAIRLNFPQQIDFTSSLSIQPGIIAPDNNYFLTAEFFDELGSFPISTSHEFSPFDKAEVITYRRRSPYSVSLLLEADNKVVDKQDLKLMVKPPTEADLETQVPFGFPEVTLTQGGAAMASDEFAKLVRKDQDIVGTVYFEDDNFNRIGRVSDVAIRNFKNLNDECAFNGLCPPPQNDFCYSIQMYCDTIGQDLVCYDLNMNKIGGICTVHDDDCSTDVRCDREEVNEITGEITYECYTAQFVYIESVDDFRMNHPLSLPACTYTAQQTADQKNAGCPRSKGCIDSMGTITTSMTATGLPDTDPCYEMYAPIMRPLTCNEDTERELINDLLDDKQYFSQVRNADGSLTFTIKYSAWQHLLGDHETFFLHVFFENTQGEMRYAVAEQEFEFLTYSDDVTYSPEAEFGEKYMCRSLPFGQRVDVALSIEDYQAQGSPAGYKIQQSIAIAEGTTLNSEYTDTSSAQIAYYNLFQAYGGISRDNTCYEEKVTYNVFDSTPTHFKKSAAMFVLQYPAGDNDLSADNCHTVTTVVKDLNGVEATKNANQKYYVNLNKEVQLEFTHAFTGCNDGANTVTRTPVQVILSGNPDLEAASAAHRKTNTALENYECEVGVFVDMTQFQLTGCMSLRGNSVAANACSQVTDNNGQKVMRMDLGGRCFLKHPDIQHPLESGSNLAPCYQQQNCGANGNINANCMVILALREAGASAGLNIPAQYFDLDCSELEAELFLLETNDNQCVGNMSPTDKYDFGGPPDELTENYLRNIARIEGKGQTEAIKLQADSDGNFADGEATVQIHTIYEKRVTDGAGVVTTTLEYSRNTLDVELFRLSASTPTSSLHYDEVVFYGEDLVVTDDLSKSDKQNPEKMFLKLEDTQCPTFELTDATVNTAAVKQVTVTYKKLLECYYSEFSSNGFEAKAKRIKYNSEDEFLSEEEFEFAVLPPFLPASYADCDGDLTVALTYKSDASAITQGADGFVITDANKDKGAILITLTGKQAENLDGFFSYGVGSGDLSQYIFSQQKESATPESLYCEDNGVPDGTNFACYDMDKQNKYETCVTDTGCTYCETRHGSISRDDNNPHPETLAEYTNCYLKGNVQVADLANCPVIPYCLDRSLDPTVVLIKSILKNYPLMDLVNTFGLMEAWPLIDWQSLAQEVQDQGLDADQKMALLESRCIDLSAMIRAQESFWYKPCEELYYRTDQEQYHPFYKANAPQYCDDGSSNQNTNQAISLLAAVQSLNYALNEDESARTNNVSVMQLDEEFIKLVRSDPTNIAASGTTIEIQILTIGELTTNQNLQVCRNTVKFAFEAPGIEVILIHPDTRNGETYTTLDYYFFAAEGINPTTDKTLNCVWNCSPAPVCPSNPESPTNDHFILSPEELSSNIPTGTQAISIDYECTVTDQGGQTTTVSATTAHTFTFEAEVADEVCEIEIFNDYFFVYDDGVVRPIYITWAEEQDANKCSYTGAAMKVRETAAACSFCGVSTRSDVATLPNDPAIKIVAINSDQIPLNTEYNIDLEISYDVTVNGATTSKKKPLKFTFFRYKEVTFSCSINGFMYFAGQDITNSIVASDTSVTNYSIIQWSCPSFINANQCGRISTSYTFTGTALSPLNIPSGEYEFCAQILYQGDSGYDACCEFSYVNENPGTSSLKAFKIVADVPGNSNTKAMKNTDIDFYIESLTGTATDIFDYASFAWKLQQDDSGSWVDIANNPIIGQDSFSHIPGYSLSPNTKYRVIATGTLSDGTSNSNHLDIKMTSRLTAGTVRVQSMTPGSTQLTSTTNLKIVFDGFQGVEAGDIYYRVKGDTGLATYLMTAYESVVENVRLPPTDQYDIWIEYVDANFWENTVAITDTITEGSAFTNVDDALNGLDFGQISRLKSELETEFQGEDIQGKIKQDFLNRFATEKSKVEIDNNTKDPKKLAKLISDLASVLEVLGDDAEVVDQVATDLISLCEEVLATSFTGSDKNQEAAAEKCFKIMQELDADTTSTDTAKNSMNKNMLSYVHQKGSMTVNHDSSQMTAKKFDLTNVRGSGQISLSQTSTANMGSGSVDLDASTFKTKGNTLGTTSLSCSVNSKTLSTNDVNAVQDGTSYLNKQTKLEFSDGTNIVDGSGISANINFDASNPTPRNLATTTTTVTNPVCYRYDSTSASWTTTGVTTVDNGSSVQCTTSLPGAVMVQYVSTTTTTTTPDPTDDSSNVGLIVGLVVGLVVIAVAITLTIIFVKKAQKKKRQRRQAAPTNLFIEDNTAEIKREKFAPDAQPSQFQKQGSLKGVTSATPHSQVVDASVTEIRPMAADDSFEKPSEGPVPIVPAPAGRTSYAKVQSEPQDNDDSVFQSKPVSEIFPTEEHKAPDNEPIISSPDLKLKKPPVIPEEPADNIPANQPDEPKNEPDSMMISQPDAGSEHGSGQGLLGAGVPESDLKVEDA